MLCSGKITRAVRDGATGEWWYCILLDDGGKTKMPQTDVDLYLNGNGQAYSTDLDATNGLDRQPVAITGSQFSPIYNGLA